MFTENKLLTKEYLRDKYLQNFIYPIDFKMSKMYIILQIVLFILPLILITIIYLGLQETPKQQIASIIFVLSILFCVAINWRMLRYFYPLHYLRIEKEQIFVARRFRKSMLCIPIQNIVHIEYTYNGMKFNQFYWVRIFYTNEQGQEKIWQWYVGHTQQNAKKIVMIIQALIK